MYSLRDDKCHPESNPPAQKVATTRRGSRAHAIKYTSYIEGIICAARAYFDNYARQTAAQTRCLYRKTTNFAICAQKDAQQRRICATFA